MQVVAAGGPGLFRFDGDTLVWVTPRGFHSSAAPPGPRPTGFVSTAENGYTVRRLKRTDGFWGWKPRDEK